jgi:hypothetical protein
MESESNLVQQLVRRIVEEVQLRAETEELRRPSTSGSRRSPYSRRSPATALPRAA